MVWLGGEKVVYVKVCWVSEETFIFIRPHPATIDAVDTCKTNSILRLPLIENDGKGDEESIAFYHTLVSLSSPSKTIGRLLRFNGV